MSDFTVPQKQNNVSSKAGVTKLKYFEFYHTFHQRFYQLVGPCTNMVIL